MTDIKWSGRPNCTTKNQRWRICQYKSSNTILVPPLRWQRVNGIYHKCRKCKNLLWPREQRAKEVFWTTAVKSLKKIKKFGKNEGRYIAFPDSFISGGGGTEIKGRGNQNHYRLPLFQGTAAKSIVGYDLSEYLLKCGVCYFSTFSCSGDWCTVFIARKLRHSSIQVKARWWKM